MIEILTKRDIGKVSQPQVQSYLTKKFTEVRDNLNPSAGGHFIYVEDFTQLYNQHRLRYVTLPSIDTGLFNTVEAVTIRDKVVEVSVFFNHECLLTLIFYDLSSNYLEVITHAGGEHTLQSILPTHNRDSSSMYSTGVSSIAVSMGMLLLRCALKR